jgi:predicted NUDIX family phosphoesterase
LFNHQNNYFIYKYLPKAGEQRLVDTFQLGIGGHINEVDVKTGESVLEVGMMREWQEEVDYKGNLVGKRLIGIINDDSMPVEKVHLGFVYLFEGDSGEISIKEKDKMAGELVEAEKIGEYIKNNNGIWVKIVYNEYIKLLK